MKNSGRSLKDIYLKFIRNEIIFEDSKDRKIIVNLAYTVNHADLVVKEYDRSAVNSDNILFKLSQIIVEIINNHTIDDNFNIFNFIYLQDRLKLDQKDMLCFPF